MANFIKPSISAVEGVAVELTMFGRNIAPHVGMGLVQNSVDIVGRPISSTVRNGCVKKIFCSVTTLRILENYL